MSYESSNRTGTFEDEKEEYVPKLSKLEMEYMEKAKQRQKDGITKP